MWFLLPMAAAMQLSAVTSHLSQDIAAIPLLWILPLATYLVTFILAFDMPRLYKQPVMARFMAVMLVSLGYSALQSGHADAGGDGHLVLPGGAVCGLLVLPC